MFSQCWLPCHSMEVPVFVKIHTAVSTSLLMQFSYCQAQLALSVLALQNDKCCTLCHRFTVALHLLWSGKQ